MNDILNRIKVNLKSMTSVFDDPEKIKDDPEINKVIRGFTEAYKAERISKGVSQMEVKRREDIAQKSISEIESGGNFRMSNYAKMCRAIGLIPVVKFKKIKRPSVKS